MIVLLALIGGPAAYKAHLRWFALTSTSAYLGLHAGSQMCYFLDAVAAVGRAKNPASGLKNDTQEADTSCLLQMGHIFSRMYV